MTFDQFHKESHDQNEIGKEFGANDKSNSANFLCHLHRSLFSDLLLCNETTSQCQILRILMDYQERQIQILNSKSRCLMRKSLLNKRPRTLLLYKSFKTLVLTLRCQLNE